MTGMPILPGDAAALISATSGNVAAATATATLAAATGKVTHITGFTVTASGATLGAVVLVTVTGPTGTLTFVFTAIAGVLLGCAPLTINFPSPIPASSPGTAIVVSMPTLGAGNTNAAIVATGFQV